MPYGCTCVWDAYADVPEYLASCAPTTVMEPMRLRAPPVDDISSTQLFALPCCPGACAEGCEDRGQAHPHLRA
eukprot:14096294-Alexandrium_andersonii.AAC.1